MKWRKLGMRRRARKAKFQRALTLIEILVVIAIALMLAGLTYKVVMRAMKKAEEVEGVSDTRQNNIGTFIDAIEEGKSYDELPDNIKEGKFDESE